MTKIQALVDSHGRRMRKLRLSLLDACNFRCFYCMPENIKFLKQDNLLSPEEIQNICADFVRYGIEEIRVTGGEPLLYKEFRRVIEKLSELPLKKLCLTTNAFHLSKELEFLQTTKCQHINISLDSLQPEKFRKIVKLDAWDKVMQAVLQAKAMGFSLKINVVMMRSVNFAELLDFVHFSEENEIEVRFLECMKIGVGYQKSEDFYVSAKEMLAEIQKQYNLIPVRKEKDSTSFNFKTKTGAQIGFIASESQAFCGSCSRLRLSATGKLRACLMSEKGISLRGQERKDYRKIIESVMAMKPIERIHHIEQPMHQIGG